ncbi:MAG: hypothetical protein LBL08_02590, partial [Candidatus Nomurabacteria bacterium]|nr:hypothetical protein [Candidatus Nomurabacteria bacterium]
MEGTVIFMGKIKQYLNWRWMVVGVAMVAALGVGIVLTTPNAPITHAANGNGKNAGAIYFPSDTGHRYHIECPTRSTGHSCWKLGKHKFNNVSIDGWDSSKDVNITASCAESGAAFPKPFTVTTGTEWNVKTASNDDGTTTWIFSLLVGQPGQDIFFYGEYTLDDQPPLQPVTSSQVEKTTYLQGETVKDVLSVKVAKADGTLASEAEAKQGWPSFHSSSLDRKMYRSLRFCVYAAGPVSGPITMNPNGSAGYFESQWGGSAWNAPRYGSIEKTWTGSSRGHECVVTGSMTKPGACSSLTGGAACKGEDFEMSFPDSKNWQPGTYSLVSRIRGSMTKHKKPDTCFKEKYPAEHAAWLVSHSDSSDNDDDLVTGWLNSLPAAAQEAAGQIIDKCNGEEWEPDGDGEVIGQSNEDLTDAMLFNGTTRTLNGHQINSKDWYSTFGEPTETFTIKRFQPRVTSAASYNAATGTALERLTSAAYVDGVLNNAGWPAGVPIKVCASLFGPYQSPKAAGSNDDSGSYAAVTQPRSTTCTGDAGQPGHFTAAGQTRDLTINTAGMNLEPGYYYFRTTTDVDQPSDATFGNSNDRIDKWTSELNPAGEVEYFVIPFQPFASSDTQFGAAGQPNHTLYVDNQTENVSDQFAFHAAANLDEANNGYQTGADKNEYWLNGGDGTPLPVIFHAYLCGPYQQPQVKNGPFSNCNSASGNLRGTTAVTAKGVGHSCLAAANVSTDCVVNFGKDFTPGYYYWTIETKKAEQTSPIGVGNYLVSDVVLGNWQSRFNPWSEAGFDHTGAEFSYVKFQPIAKSSLVGRKSADVQGASNQGIIFDFLDDKSKTYHGCEEVRDGTAHYGQGTQELEKIPPEYLTCHNLVDRIYLGATDKTAISGSNGAKTITNANHGDYWPKRDNGTYEPVNFRVKMYGPFADMDSADGVVSTSFKPGEGGYNVNLPLVADGAGLVKDSIGTPQFSGSNRTNIPQNIRALQHNPNLLKDQQPAAQSCLITANYGPNWDKFKPTGDNSQNPIAGVGGDGYYKAVLMQGDLDPNKTSGDGATCSNGLPTNSVLKLRPGIYISVVEIYSGKQPLQIDSDDQAQVVNNKNGNDNTQANALGGGDANKTLRGGSVSDMILENFHSKYGDPAETLMVPLPLFLWTQRNDSQDYVIKPGGMVTDTYWATGFRATYYHDDDGDGVGEQKIRYDVLGKQIQGHNTDQNNQQDKDQHDHSYQGDDNYFKGDNSLSHKLTVTLYGPYSDMPDSNDSDRFCSGAGKVVKTYPHLLEAIDKTAEDSHTKGTTIYDKGWYVFTFKYDGDSRIAPFTTDCSDGDEMFLVDDAEEPRLVTYINTANKQAPTVITDKVVVTGSPILKDSVVKLTLYKRRDGADANNPERDQQLCVVRFTIDQAGTYNTADYINENTGKVNSGQGSGNCFAETYGFYYWREEFLKPDKTPDDDSDNEPYIPAQNGGPGEEITLDQDKPKVETSADPTTQVGSPFSDIAIVTIPKGDKHDYFLYFEAYGPVDNG